MSTPSNTKSQQAGRAAGQTSVEPQARPNRATRQHLGQAAIAIVTIAVGAALTVLVIGVTGGTDSKPPPSPGVSLEHASELAPDYIDPQLARLARERLAVSPEYVDPQLAGLAEERFAVPPEYVDPQLETLAEQWAARQRVP
ncbi:MAG TPA: hypothetical protein VFY88_15515 [Intrasporangium sp.]|nr:hypothetical protein [Intrasporangium sp.]